MQEPWSRNRQAVAIALWVSFLAAAVGTMVLFAYIDPDMLGYATHGKLDVGRHLGSAIGFFFLWFICAGAAAVTAYLVRTAPKRPRRFRRQKESRG